MGRRYLILTAAFAFLVSCGGGGGTSTPSVTPKAAPTVVVSGLRSGDTIHSSSSVPLAIAVTNDPSLTIASVKLLRDGVEIGSDTVAPYEFILSAQPKGLHSYEVRATDSASNVGTSSLSIGITDVSNGGDIAFAINAGGPAYLATDGIAYSADEGFSNGLKGSAATKTVGTHDPVLFQTYRSGGAVNFKKSIANGRYHVRLMLADTTSTASGQREFSVSIEGSKILTSLDPYRDLSVKNLAYDISFADISVTDGELNINLSALKSEAMVAAIVVSRPTAYTTGYSLVWADEFNTDGAFDSTKWTAEVQPPGWVNRELQYYTNRSENVRVSGGNLIIESRQDGYLGANYSSARLRSQGKGDFKYGRVEVRAKLPAGKGLWPAIWLMPNDINGYGAGWPDSGEVDIMEQVGFDPNRIHASNHTKTYGWPSLSHMKSMAILPDVTTGYHVYAAQWDADKIDIYVDDVLYYTYINDHQGWQTWPYDKPFYIILNLAVGGDWAGAQGIDNAIFPQQMLVDYVRVYQKP